MTERQPAYLHLFRHGESDINTKPGTFGGRQNKSPLTSEGRAQVARLGRYLKRLDIRPAAVYSSIAVRASGSGRIALRSAGMSGPVLTTPALQELDRGSWTGRLRTEVTGDRQVRARMQRLKMNFKPDPTAESMNDVVGRMLGWTKKAVATRFDADSPRHIFAFTHSNAIGCFAAHVRGIQRIYDDSIPVAYASHSTFQLDGDNHWRELSFNVNTQQ